MEHNWTPSQRDKTEWGRAHWWATERTARIWIFILREIDGLPVACKERNSIIRLNILIGLLQLRKRPTTQLKNRQSIWIATSLKLNTYKKNAVWTPLRCHFSPTRLAKTQKFDKTLFVCGEIASHTLLEGMGINRRSLSGNLKWQMHIPSNSTSTNYPTDNSHVQNGINVRLVNATFVTAKSWKQL